MIAKKTVESGCAYERRRSYAAEKRAITPVFPLRRIIPIKGENQLPAVQRAIASPAMRASSFRTAGNSDYKIQIQGFFCWYRSEYAYGKRDYLVYFQRT